jgi:hypothetical protein
MAARADFPLSSELHSYVCSQGHNYTSFFLGLGHAYQFQIAEKFRIAVHLIFSFLKFQICINI